jgi:hypothetical protein
MDKDVRNAIERATQKARRILEEDFAEQLDATYDVRAAGHVAEKGGTHLTGRQHLLRDKIVAAIEHKRSAAMKPPEAVADYIRDVAFTALNRFVALKMLEARELVQECISRGDGSSGFTEFFGLAPAVKVADGAGYRLYIESIFDELSTEVKVLFDRRDAASVLWPKKATFDELLAILNADELKGVWNEDETIGWVYQFFNSDEERRKMREDNAAPKNGRELAIRNQFFTPRYVVQFLSDNTLGRVWYEMRNGDTRIEDICEYMVKAPEEKSGARKEYLRPKKDPRDIRIIDPACGSGHFLLYCFILLLLIYEEAWADDEGPKSAATGRTLRNDYPGLEELRKAAPELILLHNLHGVDIDPRCAQIAQLALWMRAQRGFKEAGIPRIERPIIRRSNIVIAEPMPGDPKLVKEFAATLRPAIIGNLFEEIVSEMRLAGEMGPLLPIEQKLAISIERARVAFVEQQKHDEGFLPGMAPVKRQSELDLSGIDNSAFFEQAEDQIIASLKQFVSNAVNGRGTRRKLFADDAEQGIAFVDLLNKRFDVILMNPPFGAPTENAAAPMEATYPTAKRELACAFIERGLQIAVPNGLLGVISTRTPLFIKTYAAWRAHVLESGEGIAQLVDLGRGVLDATVEASAYILDKRSVLKSVYFRGTDGAMVLDDVAALLQKATRDRQSLPTFVQSSSAFKTIPMTPIAYWADDEISQSYRHFGPFEDEGRKASSGASTNDDFRFLRLWCEVPIQSLGGSREDTQSGKMWIAFAKGGEYAPYYRNLELVINWAADGKECKEFIGNYRERKGWGYSWSAALNGYEDYFRPGVSWSRRTSTWLSGRAFPSGCIFGDKGPSAFVPNDDRDALKCVLAWINSSVVSYLISLSVGKEGAQGTAASNSYEVGVIERLPFPGFAAFGNATSLAEEACNLRREVSLTDELNRLFTGPLRSHSSESVIRARQLQERIDQVAGEAFGIHKQTLAKIEPTSRIKSLDAEDPFETVFAPNRDIILSQVQFVVGIAFGRWGKDALGKTFVMPEMFDALPPLPPAAANDFAQRAILVDDRGNADDIVAICSSIFEALDKDHLIAPPNLDGYFKKEFFLGHLAAYSRSKRRAPIYWQLTTSSSQYSVWLYIHAFTKDTFFSVQSDYVAPKLSHERRQLDALRVECGSNPSSGQLKAIEAQETFVEELQAFFDEVKRIAPLWNPNLNDGVTINCAPLWRLGPQNRAWQKELKSTWQTLANGEYDWAHLAMHLWPERVVPKCAEDRSLAIAHGLEDVFWLEDEDGKWKPRDEPQRSVADLVSERSSTAVKAALKSLLDAPESASGAKRSRKSKAA